MPVRLALIVAAALLISAASAALADGLARNKSHYRYVYEPQTVVPLAPAPSAFGGRLVMHPAWNIACNTRDSGTRALPCNQPVWVYGIPCEIGLGRGRYRNCD
jgi:hypothetical protein